MGVVPSSFSTQFQIHDGKSFRISSHVLLDHIALLRRVIEHPEMTQKGKILDDFIEDYCRRMARQEMGQKHQQSKLPWQIDWIWHVHRLHPIAYNNDCAQQLPDGKLVDKEHTRLRIRKDRKYRSAVSSEPVKGRSIFSPAPVKSPSTFVPSIDLASAVLRQCDFLKKFELHPLFALDFRLLDRNGFEKMVQNYISFMKLANQNELIVPTFEIDLIWHTFMRYPSRYEMVSKALCGFLLDHNDSIESDILQNAYQKTADRWKATYNINYGRDIEKDKLRTSQYISSCAIIFAQTVPNTSNGGAGGGRGRGRGRGRGGRGGGGGGRGGGGGGCGGVAYVGGGGCGGAGGGCGGGGGGCGGDGGGCGGGDCGGCGGCGGD